MPPQWKWKQFCKQAATNGIFPASGKAQGIISRPIEISWLQTSALVMSRHKDHPGKCLGIFTLGHVYAVSYALQNALGHLWESLERNVGPGSLVVTDLGWGNRPGFPELCRPATLADGRSRYLIKAELQRCFSVLHPSCCHLPEMLLQLALPGE